MDIQSQSVWQSKMFILGLIGSIIQGICGVMLAGGWIDAQIAGAVVAAFAGILGFCNGNNPSVVGQYILPTSSKEEDK